MGNDTAANRFVRHWDEGFDGWSESDLKPDANLVSFNLTEEEIVYAKRIVEEINKQIQKQFVPPNPENDLAARLAGLGGKEKVEAPPIIGMSDENTLILPDDVPKE